ncbi:conserved hypothetical protein, partial [Ricinus communis]
MSSLFFASAVMRTLLLRASGSSASSAMVAGVAAWTASCRPRHGRFNCCTDAFTAPACAGGTARTGAATGARAATRACAWTTCAVRSASTRCRLRYCATLLASGPASARAAISRLHVPRGARCHVRARLGGAKSMRTFFMAPSPSARAGRSRATADRSRPRTACRRISAAPRCSPSPSAPGRRSAGAPAATGPRATPRAPRGLRASRGPRPPGSGP